jgi:hypothetical protein
MIVALLAFVRESDLRALRISRLLDLNRGGLRSRSARSLTESAIRNPQSAIAPAVLSLALFVFTGAVWMLFVVAQRASDAAGRDRWSYLDEQTADDILAAQPPRAEDYVHRMEIGSRLGYRQVFGERENFPRGSTIFVVVRLAMQRQEPLELQWVLRDSAGNELQRHRRTLAPAFSYVSFAFQTAPPELPAGEYEIVLEADGQVAARKAFRLVE